MQANNNSSWPPVVMVRGWGDEPVRMVMYRIENKHCYVGREGSARTIGLPVDQVFAFDSDRFADLRTAFSQMDKNKVGEIWANIPVDELACNRYQDMLKCSHGKERIANPEGPTGSDHQ